MGEGGGLSRHSCFPQLQHASVSFVRREILKSKENEKGVSSFHNVYCNPPRGPTAKKKKTLLGLSNGKLCVPNEMYSDLSVNTFLIYISH